MMQKKVIIIGAGAAGLQTALSLHQKFEVEILEASNHYGGRVRTDFTFADIPVELGGEEIAGEKSLHYKYASQMGIQLIDEDNLTLYVDEKGHFQREEDVKSTEARKAIDFTEIIENYTSQEDISVVDYLHRHGFPKKVRFILENNLGREWGTNLENLSMKSLHEYYTKNTLGDKTYFLTEGSQTELLKWKFHDILPLIKFNKIIKKVDYSLEDKITIYDSNGESHTCDYLFVCVPLAILKGSFIEFQPSLPPNKQAALEVLSMEAGAKIVMKFSETFWPHDLKNTIEDDMFNYIWSPSNPRSEKKAHVLIALITGKDAISLTLMSEEELQEKMLAALSKFGKTKEEIKKLLLGFKVQNWLLEPFIKGVYSYPALGLEGSKFREIMMQPLDNRIFFAGEAFNKENYSTIGSALQSGLKAASQLKKLYKNEKTKLKLSQPSNEQTEMPKKAILKEEEKTMVSLNYRALKVFDHFHFIMNKVSA